MKYQKSDRWLLKLDAQSKSFELLRDRTLGVEDKPTDVTDFKQFESNSLDIKTPPKKKMKAELKKKQKIKSILAKMYLSIINLTEFTGICSNGIILRV